MNDQFDCMEDWDLQAVVRGWSTAATNTTQVSPCSSNNLMDFQDNFDIKSFFDELYDPVSLSQPISSPIILNTNSMSVPAEDKHLERHDKPKLSSKPVVEKSRRNQHKKVVKQVTAECLSSDMWTWRKYGQKPIKGSPYPRSYYRCSSLKGCLARKQVEKSNTDPNLFVITYTSDHNHAHPVRRGSASRGGRNKSVNLEEVAKRSKSAEVEFGDHLVPKMEEIAGKSMELECASDEMIMPVDMDDLFEDFEGISPSLEFLINGC